MSKFFLTLLVLCTAMFACSQTAFKKNDIYLEAGGNGLFGSVNYERQFTNSPGLAARMGVGFYTENDWYLTIPVGLHYLFALKKKNAFIDAGLGTTWTRLNGRLFRNSDKEPEDHFVNFVPSVGYRKHTSKEVMWRINIAPIINRNGVVPWLGVSVGKRV